MDLLAGEKCRREFAWEKLEQRIQSVEKTVDRGAQAAPDRPQVRIVRSRVGSPVQSISAPVNSSRPSSPIVYPRSLATAMQSISAAQQGTSSPSVERRVPQQTGERVTLSSVPQSAASPHALERRFL